MEQLIYPILGAALFLGLTYKSLILVHGLPLVYYIAIGLAGICIFVFAVNTFLSRTYTQQVYSSKTTRILSFVFCSFATFATVGKLQAQSVVSYATITGTSLAGVGYVTPYTDVNGISAEIGRWDTPYPNGSNGAYAPGLQPTGKSIFYVDVNVNEGGIASFSYKLQTYDAGVYDWLDIYVETPTETISLLDKLGKPGVDYGSLFESAYIPLSVNLDRWKNQHIKLVFSVEQDGWGDQTQGLVTSLAVRPCKVAPLKVLKDPVAITFEGGQRVNTSKLVDDMKTALDCLQTAVTNAKGTLTVNSAYRPPEYQDHLREVWDKWQLLKNNKEKECAELKAKVKTEFEGHDLLDTQRPAGTSKHTQGKAIDISSSLSIPKLVELADGCKLKRPLPVADPVHYILK